jgi:acetyl esterase/lipase
MTEHLVGSRIPDLRTLVVGAVLRLRMKHRGKVGPITAAGLRRSAQAFEQGLGRAPLPPFVTVEPVDTPAVKGEWVSAGTADQGVVLFFHGGGFVMGSPATHRSGTWRIARATGRRVLAIRYRYAPDHAFPAWIDDGVAAYRWLLEQGIAPGSILVSGDSAGGNMALAVTHRLRGEKLPMPGGLILFSPWGDLACASPSYRNNARTEAMFRTADVRATGAFLTAACDPRNPEVSPVHADLQGFPPILLFAGAGELFVDDARTIRRNAAAAGVKAELHVYRHMPHVFPLLAGVLPRAKPAYDTITRFASALPA